jgi:nucleoside-diphosphate-sugar epimerase
MPHRIFLAGAGGALGRRLTPMLVAAGHPVVGTTRSADKASAIRELGAEAVVVDVFDAAALARAVAAASPEILIHQLTDLPRGLDPSKMDEATRRNARIRTEGTRNLVDAAVAAGARRLIAQSIAWAYAPGAEPYDENAPLDLAAEGRRAISVGGVVALERAVLDAPLEGLVLRYGQLYGPGTGVDMREGASPVHVDDAARAVLLALDYGEPGVYNIAERGGAVDVGKADRELGWRAEPLSPV